MELFCYARWGCELEVEALGLLAHLIASNFLLTEINKGHLWGHMIKNILIYLLYTVSYMFISIPAASTNIQRKVTPIGGLFCASGAKEILLFVPLF